MATLRGYAIRASSSGSSGSGSSSSGSSSSGSSSSTTGGIAADHTYVRSDDGYKWGCFGRDSGGSQVCAGTAGSKKADCLSKPRTSVYYAGLLYAVHGVCHQAANRILYRTGRTVSAANGYWASWAVYGTYGTNYAEWVARRYSCLGGL